MPHSSDTPDISAVVLNLDTTQAHLVDTFDRAAVLGGERSTDFIVFLAPNSAPGSEGVLSDLMRSWIAELGAAAEQPAVIQSMGLSFAEDHPDGRPVRVFVDYRQASRVSSWTGARVG